MDLYAGTINKELSAHLDTYVRSYSKLVAKKKRAGVMAYREGKDPMPQRAYVKIAEKLLLYDKDQCDTDNDGRKRFTFGEYIFPWIYLILSWVLMGRKAIFF